MATDKPRLTMTSPIVSMDLSHRSLEANSRSSYSRNDATRVAGILPTDFSPARLRLFDSPLRSIRVTAPRMVERRLRVDSSRSGVQRPEWVLSAITGPMGMRCNCLESGRPDALRRKELGDRCPAVRTRLVTLRSPAQAEPFICGGPLGRERHR
jgi:hypothetical protein